MGTASSPGFAYDVDVEVSAMVGGIGMLREERGSNTVTFNEIADHLFDFCELHPHEAAVLERFAAFLTAVEHIPHDHDADPDRGLSAPVASRARI